MHHSLRFLTFVGIVAALATGRSQAQAGPNAASQNASATPAAIKPDSVFINPEVRPQFTGGDKAFTAYLSKNIHYPQLAIQRRVSGKVYVNFILSAQGKVQDAHVVSGPGNGLNEEALRLIKTAPKWEPAMYQGKPIKQKMAMPVLFQL